MAGETGDVLMEMTRPIASVIGGLFAIAVYNSLEIYISIFRTFRRRRGLYFWSALCANTGIPWTSLFVLLRNYDLVAAGPTAILVDIGWWFMVNGQSLMLYSRLNLVMGDPQKLRWLLWMIVGSFVLLQIPTGVLFAYVSFNGHRRERATDAFDAIEITQLATITVQECLLSGLYVYTSKSTLKPMKIIRGPKVRKLFREIIALFVLVVALDISLVIVQFVGLFYIQTTYKPLVYSIKLKVETFVLNNLVALLVHPGCSCLEAGFPSDSRELNVARANSADDPWRLRLTRSAGATNGTDGSGASGSAGGESVSSSTSTDGGRVKMLKEIPSL